MAALPFGKSSLRVRRGGEVQQRETESSGVVLQSTSGKGKGAREEFLEGNRREQPYRVRRMEMVVGGRGRRVQLDYMESLLASGPLPSLSSLPTPTQLCRKRKSNPSDTERMERKRKALARDDHMSNVQEHLAHLHRKQRLCDLDSGLVGALAQEVPCSPRRADLPVEETSLTLHGRTPLKHQHHHRSHTVEEGGHRSYTVEEGGHRSYTVEKGGHCSYTAEEGGHWVTGGDEQRSLFPPDDEEREQSREEELELQRQFGMGPELELPSLGIEQELDSFATTEEGVRGSELNREGEEGDEEGKNAQGTRPGFRLPGGALERMWLAHSRDQVEGRRARRDGGGKESGTTHGGLKIRPVEEYFEGVPFNRTAAVETQWVPMDQKHNQGFSELLSSHPHHESFPSSLLQPRGHTRPPLPREPVVAQQQQRSTLDHMMELCFNPQTLTIRNHFPREE